MNTETGISEQKPSPQMTVVALHGNGGGAFRFERLYPSVPPDIRFRAVTLPGFADVPSHPSLRSLKDYAGCLHEMTAAEPRPLVLLGHGIGGSIVLEYLQQYRSDVDGVILHAPVGARLRKRFFPALMALPGARELGRRIFASRAARPLFRRMLFRYPVPTDYLNRFFEEYRHCSVFAQMFDLVTPEWFSRLQAVDLPARLLWGARERVLKVEQAEDFRRLLPRATVRIVERWDHFPMIEQPEEYTAEVALLARELVAECRNAEQQ